MIRKVAMSADREITRLEKQMDKMIDKNRELEAKLADAEHVGSALVDELAKAKANLVKARGLMNCTRGTRETNNWINAMNEVLK